MKKCSLCKLEKAESEFYKDSRTKSGLYSGCKECIRPCPKNRRRGITSEERRERKRITAIENYYANKKSLLARSKESHLGRPWLAKAHTAVDKAIKSGKLVRKPCEVCEDTLNVVAHHDDYNFFLKVRWLCRSHHVKWHKINKPITPRK